MSDHLYGNAIPIIKYLDDKTISFDEENIDKLFNHPEIQDRKIVIFSLIGAFRGGKSFFLNYCLRFLYAHFASINNPSKETQFIFENDENWMGDGDKPLKGFPWRAGTERDTTGILIWNDVFLHTFDRSGEKVAIFVMDTQGLFDNKSTQTDNSRIFSLGTLLSSIQIFNLRTIIQEDQLQYLQFATEFTKFTANDENQMEGKPFQHLTFLIRDWDNEDEFSFGIEGGKKYFEDRVIKSTTSEIEELKSVRESITNAFEQIGCCLLPHPGKKVTKKDYNGCWSNMDEDFKTELKNFIENLLLPQNLIIKKINSRNVKGRQMKTFVIQYLMLFKSGQILNCLNILEANIESQMYNLIERCIEEYKQAIILNEYFINKENINTIHKICKERALDLYTKKKKMGNDTQKKFFETKLVEKLENYFIYFKEQKERNMSEIEKERKQTLDTFQKQQELINYYEKYEILLNKLKDSELKFGQLKFENDKLKEELRITKSRLEEECKRAKKYKKKFIEEENFSSKLKIALGVSGGIIGGILMAPVVATASTVAAAGVVATGTIGGLLGSIPSSNYLKILEFASDVIKSLSKLKTG